MGHLPEEMLLLLDVRLLLSVVARVIGTVHGHVHGHGARRAVHLMLLHLHGAILVVERAIGTVVSVHCGTAVRHVVGIRVVCVMAGRVVAGRWGDQLVALVASAELGDHLTVRLLLL